MWTITETYSNFIYQFDKYLIFPEIGGVYLIYNFEHFAYFNEWTSSRFSTILGDENYILI